MCAVCVDFVNFEGRQDAPGKPGGIGQNDPLVVAVDVEGFFKFPQVGQVDPGGCTAGTGGIFQDGREGSAVLPDFGADNRSGLAEQKTQAIQVVDHAAGKHEEGAGGFVGDRTDSLSEGGLAGGLLEIATAANVGIAIDRDRLPVLPECQAVCDALGLDPLGLIASGALLATVARNEAAALVSALQDEGIAAFEIGVVTDANQGLTMKTGDAVEALPRFERDELARFEPRGE